MAITCSKMRTRLPAIGSVLIPVRAAAWARASARDMPGPMSSDAWATAALARATSSAHNIRTNKLVHGLRIGRQLRTWSVGRTGTMSWRKAVTAAPVLLVILHTKQLGCHWERVSIAHEPLYPVSSSTNNPGPTVGIT
jgi:hypothetical protein